MKIYLMRHGEPTYEDCFRMGLKGQGAELGQLTAAGIAQAEEGAKDPRIQDVDLIVSSPYPRALQTAAIVSRRIDRPIEVAVGIFEWMPDLDSAEMSPKDIYDAWQEYKQSGGVHLPEHRYHNWETHAQLRARVLPWVQRYAARTDIEKLLIVCHGGVMRALLNEPSLKKIHFCEIRELPLDCLNAECGMRNAE